MTVVMGGCFDPPHNAHVEMVRHLSKRADVDKIIIIPTFLPPHKENSVAPYYCRMDMAKLAFGNINKVTVSDIESKLEGKSYSVETLKALNEKDVLFVIGADEAETIDMWKNPTELARLCRFAVFKRNGNLNTSALEKIGAKYEIIDFLPQNVSSTALRKKLDYSLLPKSVESYIKSHSLYSTELIYIAEIKANLTEKRFNHSLNVANEALRLSKMYGGDERLIYTAALLHDVTKDCSKNQQLQLMQDFGIILSGLEKNAPKLWHAITGAYYAKNILKIDSDEVFSAIRYHTTAKSDMTLTEKLVYLADYTSADRDYNGIEEMREAVNTSLSKAMSIATTFTVEDLTKRNLAIHPDSLDAYNQYK